MSTESNATARRRLVVLVVLLILLLLGLAFAYWSLIRPPVLASGETSVDTEGYDHRFSLYGFGPERLSRPGDVAIGDDGRIYVTDTFNHRIVVYDERGRYLEHFGDFGSGQYEIEFPSGIAVAPDGTVFVLCKSLDKVVIYSPSHEPTWEILVDSPQVATVFDGRLYLATYRGVMIGDLEGNVITSFGRRGSAPGQVDHPGGIAVAADGTIYLSDSLNYRIQALDEDGNAIWVAGDSPAAGDALRDSSRRFGLPTGLTLGSDGLLYLIDAFTGTLQILDPADGSEISRVGDWGHDEGMLYYPSGIAHGDATTFAVADRFNDRVQIFDVYSPLESPLEAALRGPWPWLLPLALLPLLFLLLRRRHTADRGFLDGIVDADAVPELARTLSRVGVTEMTQADLANVVQEDVRMDSLMRRFKVNQRKAARLAERHELDEESAMLLARAKRPLRLPSILLADDPALRTAAERERITRLSAEEVLGYWGRGSGPEKIGTDTMEVTE